MGNVLLAHTPREYTYGIISDPDAAEAVYREMFTKEEWKQLDAGTITEEDAVAQIQQRIPQYADSVQHAMDLWHSDLTPIAGMPEIIDQLKEKNYRIYLLSNVSLRFLKFYRKVEMFSHFDGFLISSKEKIVKPDAAIYKLLLKRFSLIPDECLFIDDLQINIDGAENVRIHGHRFGGAEELSTYLKQQGIL